MNETRERPAPPALPADALVVPADDAAARPTNISGPLLRAEGLTKTYAMGGAPLRVLTDCSLQVRAGEFVAIMGRSGSGKSTLLHLLGAIDRPDKGEVFLADRPLFGTENALERFSRGAEVVFGRIAAFTSAVLRYALLPACGLLAVFWVGALLFRLFAGRWASTSVLTTAAWISLIPLGLIVGMLLLWILAHGLRTIAGFLEERQRVHIRRRDFGFVFQFYHLLPELNVLENTLLTRMIGSSIAAWFTGERGRARADALAILTRVGLGERLHHRPNQLSGGERQRVAIARALIHKPAVLLADEPTGNLDAAAGRQLMDLLLQLNREGQTTVMVTHDAAIAALAHRVLRLEEGRLVDT